MSVSLAKNQSFQLAWLTIVSLSPSFFKNVKVFMIACSVSSGKHVACGGRRLAWIRIHAWGACDPGFKSQRPHQPNSSVLCQNKPFMRVLGCWRGELGKNKSLKGLLSLGDGEGNTESFKSCCVIII